MSQTTTAKAGAKGNGAPASLPVIPRNRYLQREQQNTVWNVSLPEGIGKRDLSAPSIFSTAPDDVQRGDILWLNAYDDSWIAEVLAIESAKHVLLIQALRVIDLPPRNMAGPSDGLPHKHRIYRGRTEEGWIVERTNPDGNTQVLAVGRDHPEWRDQYEAARNWLRSHATIQKP